MTCKSHLVKTRIRHRTPIVFIALFCVILALVPCLDCARETSHPVLQTETHDATGSNVTKAGADVGSPHAPHETEASQVGGGNESEHAEGEGEGLHDEGEHAARIHVASLRWDYVQEPFVITVFVIVAGVAKIGKTTGMRVTSPLFL